MKHDENSCDPEDVVLSEYPQWKAEVGYWIGEYSFFGADGNPNISPSWNYPYDHYMGFITGNIQNNAYRQRNVFLYPPQSAERCAIDGSTEGEGICGVNGNTKVFSADQTATTCSTVPGQGGTIEGPYAGVFKTKTELVGKDNALLYQVFYDKDAFELEEDKLLQSQLTTISTNMMNETVRVRTAQSFSFDGNPAQASFYREKIVTKEEFYSRLIDTLADYSILHDDTCSNFGLGYDGCVTHLEESFQMGEEESEERTKKSKTLFDDGFIDGNVNIIDEYFF